MKVFCLFKITKESDGYTIFELVAIHSSLEKAKINAKIFFEEHMELKRNWRSRIDFVHPSMNMNNYGTHHGLRKDCNIHCDGFGGMLIEEMEMD